MLSTPLLLGGLVVAFAGLRSAGSRVRRTRYRPARWGAAEWTVVTSGWLAAALTWWVGATDAMSVHPGSAPCRS
ncbi:MAG: hypothetical protein R2731_18565 [Nocardioides sp.]